MRVLYISTTDYADSDTNLLKHISNKVCFTYSIIIPKQANNYSEQVLSQYCVDHNIEFIPVQLNNRRRNPLSVLKYLKIISKVFRQSYDVIIINNFDDIYFNLLCAFFVKSKNTIITLHDVVNHEGLVNNYFQNIGKKILLASFKNFLTFSKYQADILQKSYPSKIVYTVPMGLKDFGEGFKKKQNYNDKVFLFFGNIEHYKGLDLLIESVNRVSIRHKNFKLIIAGRCKEWHLYQKLIKNKSAFDLQIGFVDNNKIPELFSTSHYLILPYRNVTQSGPLMIAYNYNTPVIASNLDGFKEFVNEKLTSLLFDINDSNQLDTALEAAILRPENEYKILKESLLEYASKNYSVEVITKKFESMLKEVKKN